MRVRILYFQDVKRRTGIPEEDLDVPQSTTVAELAERIVALHPAVGPLSRSLLFAVNEEHATRDQALAEGDTVALMPPFSGG